MSNANKKAPGIPAPEANANDAEHKKKQCHSTLANPTGSPFPARVEARMRRDAALGLIARRADPAWLATAESALLAAIDRQGSACVDDCRYTIAMPRRAHWWCIVPRMLCVRGIIRRVGSRPGVAPVTHKGDLRLWGRVEAKR